MGYPITRVGQKLEPGSSIAYHTFTSYNVSIFNSLHLHCIIELAKESIQPVRTFQMGETKRVGDIQTVSIQYDGINLHAEIRSDYNTNCVKITDGAS